MVRGWKAGCEGLSGRSLWIAADGKTKLIPGETIESSMISPHILKGHILESLLAKGETFTKPARDLADGEA